MHKIATVLLIVITMARANTLENNRSGYSLKNLKSESTAQRWSELTTLIPVLIGVIPGRFGQPYRGILAGVGIIVGPGTGHFYAHQWARGLKGIGLRVGIGAAGTSIVLSQVFGRDVGDISEPVVYTTIAVASGALLASLVYDITTAPASARTYNECIRNQGNLHFQPLIDLEEERVGLSLVYRF